MGDFGPKIIVVLKAPDALYRFKKNFHNERGQEAYEIYISGFCKKDLVQGE